MAEGRKKTAIYSDSIVVAGCKNSRRYGANAAVQFGNKRSPCSQESSGPFQVTSLDKLKCSQGVLQRLVHVRRHNRAIGNAKDRRGKAPVYR